MRRLKNKYGISIILRSSPRVVFSFSIHRRVSTNMLLVGSRDKIANNFAFSLLVPSKRVHRNLLRHSCASVGERIFRALTFDNPLSAGTKIIARGFYSECFNGRGKRGTHPEDRTQKRRCGERGRYDRCEESYIACIRRQAQSPRQHRSILTANDLPAITAINWHCGHSRTMRSRVSLNHGLPINTTRIVSVALGIN